MYSLIIRIYELYAMAKAIVISDSCNLRYPIHVWLPRLCADLLISLLDTAVETLASRPLSEAEKQAAHNSLLPPIAKARSSPLHCMRG